MPNQIILSLNFVGGPEDGLVKYYYGDPPTHFEFDTVAKRKVSYVVVSKEQANIDSTDLVTPITCKNFQEVATNSSVLTYVFAGYQQ